MYAEEPITIEGEFNEEAAELFAKQITLTSMQDESSNDFFEFVRSPASCARQHSEHVKLMQIWWKDTDDYLLQPDEESRKRQLKVVWFTYFRVIASIYLEAGEASTVEISQNLSAAI
jgi:hypothetical protein